MPLLRKPHIGIKQSPKSYAERTVAATLWLQTNKQATLNQSYIVYEANCKELGELPVSHHRFSVVYHKLYSPALDRQSKTALRNANILEELRKPEPNVIAISSKYSVSLRTIQTLCNLNNIEFPANFPKAIVRQDKFKAYSYSDYRNKQSEKLIFRWYKQYKLSYSSEPHYQSFCKYCIKLDKVILNRKAFKLGLERLMAEEPMKEALRARDRVRHAKRKLSSKPTRY